jgi:hypothetical protein
MPNKGHRGGQRVRQFHENRRGAPDHARQLVGEQHQAEGGEHVVQVIAPVQREQADPVDHRAQHEHPAKPRQHGERKGAAGVPRRGGKVRAEHVQRAVRQVDEAHDAEHQRQAGGHQEQQHAELQAVERLDQQQFRRHAAPASPSATKS